MAPNKSIKPPKQNDELLKGAFEENFPDFLRFLYADADAIFDLSRKIEFMDKELLAIVPDRERKKGKRVADLLAKVFLNDGTEKWILIHTEIEGGRQEDFSFRLFHTIIDYSTVTTFRWRPSPYSPETGASPDRPNTDTT